MARYPRHDHAVRFYESEEFLLASLIEFLEPALCGDDAGIVIATPDLRSRLDTSLAEYGVDAEDLRRDERLVVIDAEAMLDTFTSDGVPDRERFRGAVEPLLDRAGEPARMVHVFGEMVTVLWDEGNIGAALTVEELWNELAGTRRFRLLCGYPIRTFASDASTEDFRRICDTHTTVLPAESFTTPSGSPGGRAVAALQQQLLAADAARQAWRTTRHELQARLEDLDASGRLREQFVTTVVHDLRTPATLVSTALGLLRQSLPERDQDVEQLLAMALEGSGRIERLVGDVLTAAQFRAEAFTYDVRPLQLGPIVERAVRGVRVSTGRTIEYVEAETLPPVVADEHRQLQIVDNLLWNAVKFSPEDSRVSVELRGSTDWLTVSVRDEGVGIAAEDQASLFHPFSRLRRSEVAGTGLGLSITKALVEGQGGAIRVASRPGAGSVFSYTVPVARSRPPGQRPGP